LEFIKTFIITFEDSWETQLLTNIHAINLDN